MRVQSFGSKQANLTDIWFVLMQQQLPTTLSRKSVASTRSLKNGGILLVQEFAKISSHISGASITNFRFDTEITSIPESKVQTELW